MLLPQACALLENHAWDAAAALRALRSAEPANAALAPGGPPSDQASPME